MELNKNDVLISLDPGYDGIKVICNEVECLFPAEIWDATAHPISDGFAKQSDYIELVDEHHYLIGAEAKRQKYGLNGEKDTDDLRVGDRFLDANFHRLCHAAIAYAIYHADCKGAIDMNAIENVYLYISLPHNIYKNYFKVMKDHYENVSHKVSLIVGSNETKVNLDICVTRVGIGSQTLNTLNAYAADATGRLDLTNPVVTNEGTPLLLLDGGYGTMGIARVEKGLSVRLSESISDFAMKTVNTKVAEHISTLTNTPYTHYQVEMATTDNEKYRYFNSEGAVESIDVRALRKEAVSKYSSDFFQYLVGNYNILQIKNILVAGGTGSCYYPGIVSACERIGLLPKEHIILVECTLGGKILDPIYTVAAGGYKSLCYLLTYRNN